jgi:hypothetical protein
MSKFNNLWQKIGQGDRTLFTLSFAGIEAMAGLPIDHSFLNAKKELLAFGYQVKKISLKEQTVTFERTIE